MTGSGEPGSREPGSRELRSSPMLVPLLAGLTTWVTLLAWTPFAENPAGFMWPLCGAVVLVAGSGMLLRSARLPAALVVLVQLVLLGLWLQHRLAAGSTIGGLVPTPTSVRAMVAAVQDSVTASRTYSAPVPASVPAFYPLLILTGALTAVLVDLLAAGLRRAPLSGLPLLAVYTVPVSILHGGVSWAKFAAAALCYLFLITAAEEHRLSQWGQRLTPGTSLFDQGATSGEAAVWSSARKIGITATALAVVAPLLLPTFGASMFGGSGGNRNAPGDGVVISNPMVDLKRDLVRGADVDLLTVRTAEPNPSYLRISVLNAFDGNAWQPSGRTIPSKQRAAGPVSAPPGLSSDVPSRSYASRVQVSDSFRSRWLPTPYPVSSVEASGDWRYDRSTLDFVSAADGQTTAGLSYRLSSLVLSPSAAELRNATPAPLSLYTPNTALPQLPAFVRRLATTVTRGKQTRFEQAVALQQFFRVGGGFRYSLQRASGNGTAALLTFLGTGRGSRVGYCEQFAAAMALMGRTLGIPSRVAVGFLHPQQTGAHTYVYSSHDLHAWPEMYFGGVGWVRFEPTPQDRTGRVPAYTTQQVPRAQAPTSSSAPSAAPSINRIDKTGGPQQSATTGTNRSATSGPGLLGWLGGALLVIALVLAPRGLRFLVRRRRWARATAPSARAEAGWSELRDSARDLAISWDDRVSLRTAAVRLVSTFGAPDPDDAASRASRRGADVNPDAAAALHRLVGLLERARYARDLPAEAAVLPVREDVDTCVRAMRAGAGARRRSRATWLPASVLPSTAARRRTRRRARVVDDVGVDRTVRTGV